MANTAQVSFRIDPEIKRDAELALGDMGLTMSAAVTVFLKTIARERRFPFEITADPFYSDSNIRWLEKVARDVESGAAHFAEHELIGDDE
ncbi:MAG: type II toxin-antitoxin system RelB/DinJ family antitoxin [Clostridia bacterium]|nr:type II toxin-antitoxin system RelB/DinJ family antitoxin [Clostridia bacterium]